MWLKCSKGPVKPHDHCSKLQQWLYYGQECNWGIHVCCSCQPGTVSSVCSVCQHQNPLLNTRWASQKGFVTSQNGFVTSPCRGTSPDTKTAYQGQCYPAENKKGKKKENNSTFLVFYKSSSEWLQIYLLKGSSLLQWVSQLPRWNAFLLV